MHLKKLSFPADHKPHDSIVEWWYFNGHLQDEKGNYYSFMDCFFRVEIEKAGIPFLRHLPLHKVLGNKRHVCFAHSVLSDIGQQINYKDVQNISLVSDDSFTKERLFINYINPFILRGFTNSEIAEIDENVFHVKTEHFDLTLKPKKQPLLSGGNGHITLGGEESYYYSITDFETSGVLLIDGKRIEVKGESWMDHQWADTPYRHDKWSWFSLKLDNGADIMCCEYGEEIKKDYFVSISSKLDKSVYYDNFVLKPGKKIWQSKLTKAKYPMSWDVEIAEYDAKLHIKSLMPDQEMIFLAINYWEGPVEVSGSVGGKKVKGFGFMELVGYPSDYNYLLTSGKEIGEKIGRELDSQILKKIFG